MGSDDDKDSEHDSGRIRPGDAIPDIVERVVRRRQIRPEDRDIVMIRERVPGLSHANTAPTLRWRYRVCEHGEPSAKGRTYNSFQHAASAAEQLAVTQRRRVLYVEDQTASVLADYRR